MDQRKLKTARFRDLVDRFGKPEPTTLWSDPTKDKLLMKAVREKRVLSVHRGGPREGRDWAEVGLVEDPNVTLLIFPRSLKDVDGRRIIGIDYKALALPKPSGSASTGKKGSEPSPMALRGLTSKAKAERATTPKPSIHPGMKAAIDAARKGLSEGGIPIGAALEREGKVVATGWNKRVQNDDPVTHGETDCLRNAGRLGSYRGCTLYSTLMPCYFCAGAAVQFGIKKVVVGECRTFAGAPEFMRSHGIEVVNLDLPECYEMMEKFIRENPALWNEDIGK